VLFSHSFLVSKNKGSINCYLVKEVTAFSDALFFSGSNGFKSGEFDGGFVLDDPLVLSLLPGVVDGVSRVSLVESEGYLLGLSSWAAKYSSSHSKAFQLMIDHLDPPFIVPADGEGTVASIAAKVGYEGYYSDLFSSWHSHPLVKRESMASTLRYWKYQDKGTIILMFCAAFITDDVKVLLKCLLGNGMKLVLIDSRPFDVGLCLSQQSMNVWTYGYELSEVYAVTFERLVGKDVPFSSNMLEVKKPFFVGNCARYLEYWKTMYPGAPYMVDKASVYCIKDKKTPWPMAIESGALPVLCTLRDYVEHFHHPSTPVYLAFLGRMGYSFDIYQVGRNILSRTVYRTDEIYSFPSSFVTVFIKKKKNEIEVSGNDRDWVYFCLPFHMEGNIFIDQSYPCYVRFSCRVYTWSFRSDDVIPISVVSGVVPVSAVTQDVIDIPPKGPVKRVIDKEKKKKRKGDGKGVRGARY